MKTLNKLYLIILISLTPLVANDAKNGEELYHFSDCTNCHEPSHFTNEDRKAKNFEELHSSVDACRYSTNVDWFDEDRDDVVHYLNLNYYQYSTEE